MGTRTGSLHKFFLSFLLFLATMTASGTAQSKRGLLIGTAAKASEPANVKVAPDLTKRLARFRSVEMPLSPSLTANERKMVAKLVEACHDLESIYWRQNDPEALALYQSLENSNATSAAMHRGRRIIG